VAQDLLAGTGLTLFWGVRDYTFHDTFNGVGSVYDLIRQLVEPWNLSTLGVDIYVTGSVLNVRQRVASPTATTTMTVAASRLVNPAAGPRQRLPLIGVVELEGRLAPGGDDPGGAEFPPGDPPPVEGSTSVVPFSRSIERNGIIITVVEGSNTYRMPDRLLTKTIERIHERNPAGLLTLQKESVTDTTFEDSRYGPGGPINQPLPLSAVTSIQTRVASATGDTTVMAETDREEITWKYDAHRFLTAKVTTKRTRQQGTIIWKETERLTETWEDKLAGWVEVTTTRTTFDADGVATNTKVIGRQDAAGFRPGGVRPPLRLRGGLSGEPGIDDASLRPIRLTATVSSDATAIPVRYSNPNLTATDLQYILDQLEAASGLYESRISGSGPAMPWMVKGTVLDLTSFLGPDGVTEIPLEPALVTRADLDYDEVGVGSVGAIEGVFYTVS
jgi:hypothetical protein